MNINITKKQKGFTLIELLVVIGIIAVLFAVVLIAIDPAKRLKQSRDSTRLQSVNSILEAVTTYVVDNYGSYPAGLSGTTTYMLGTSACSPTLGSCSTSGCLDLSTSTALVPNYLSAIPTDPSIGSSVTTGYSISKNTAGRVTVIACGTEGTSTISVQR